MKFEIRPRDRRALVLLVLALVVYGALKLAAFPVYDRLARASDAAVEKETQLRRYRRAELRKGQYAEITKLASAKLEQNEAVLSKAANESLLSAELQARLEAAAVKVGLMFNQRSVGQARRLNDFYWELPMTLGFESTPGQLVMFLVELRTVPQFVTVRAVQVTPVQPVQEVPKVGDLTKSVRVTMTIAAAYYRADIVKK